MRYGICTFPTDYSFTPAELGPAVEERGFESLWVAEHSHIPASRATPWPGGAELPKMYYDVFDPFVALTAAAATTRTLRLGTGVCLVAQRDPIQLAKQVATLDRISSGRFLFGVGGGWNVEEMANHGTDARQRFAVMRERIEAMKAVWTARAAAEYHGAHVDFDPIFAWPKPVQKPHPPIHVGGAAPWGMRRAVRYGDGWIPLLGRGQDDVVTLLPALRAEAECAGRDPASIEVSVYGVLPDAERCARYRDAGITRVLFFLPPVGRDDTLTILDAGAACMAAAGD